MAEDMNTPWTARRDDSGGEPGLWSVIDASGAIVFFGMSEDIARLFAAAPDLLAALTDMFALMDEGWLVRDTSKDHEPSFAMRQLSFVQRLAKAHAAIAKAEPAAPKQPGET